MKLPEFALLLIGVLLNCSAQLLLKTAAQAAGPIELQPGEAGAFARALFAAPACWAAVAMYGVSGGVWAGGLSRVPVSQAYPLLSLGYVLTLLAGWWLLGETPSPMRVAGVGVIIVGVALVATS